MVTTRAARSLAWSGVAVLALAVAGRTVPCEPAWAVGAGAHRATRPLAPVEQVTLRPPAVRTATSTATPRLRLPTAPTDPAAGGAPQPTTVDGPVGTSATAAAGAGADGTPRSGAEGGVAPVGIAPPPGSPGRASTPDIDGPALPGALPTTGIGAGPASGTPARPAVVAPMSGAAGARAAPTPGSVLPPLGLAAVEDPVVVRMWSQYGSPYSGTVPIDRVIGGRPGPWGMWSFYLLLVAAFGLALRGVLADLGGPMPGPLAEADEPASRPPAPQTAAGEPASAEDYPVPSPVPGRRSASDRPL